MPEGALFYEEKIEEEEEIENLSPNDESKKLITYSLWIKESVQIPPKLRFVRKSYFDENILCAEYSTRKSTV